MTGYTMYHTATVEVTMGRMVGYTAEREIFVIV